MSYDTKIARLLADMVGTVGAGADLSGEENRRVYQSLRDGANEVERLRKRNKELADGNVEMTCESNEQDLVVLNLGIEVERLREYMKEATELMKQGKQSLAEAGTREILLRVKHETLLAAAEMVISPRYGDMTGARKNLIKTIAACKEEP